MSHEQNRKMKSSKVQRDFLFSSFWCQMTSVTRVLLGICVLLLEIEESKEMSGLGWGSCTTLIATAATAAVTATSLSVVEVGIPKFNFPSPAPHVAPTLTLITPTQLGVLEGENVEIGCIPNGNPLPSITWTIRDGQIPIPKSMLHDHRITLEKVTRRHTGLYVCEGENGVGRPAVGAVYVRVLHTPEIEIPKTRVHGGVGYKAELICFINADPPAEVKWRIGEEMVNSTDRISTELVNRNEHVLILNPVKEYDFNTYSCEANNSQGYETRQLEFTGTPNTPIISRWETQTLTKGSATKMIQQEVSVTLYWAVECKSNLIDHLLHFKEADTSQWTLLTIPADHSTAFLHTKTFMLRGLKPLTIYEAAIKARNKHGWSPISEICYFSTFPNSSSANQEEFEGFHKKWRESMIPDGKGGFRRKESGNKSSQNRVRFEYSPSRICAGALLLYLLSSLIYKYSAGLH